MSMSEIWKPVIGFEECYEVSNLGRVRSIDRVDSLGRKIRGKVIHPIENTHGYEQVRFIVNSRRYHRSVHRLVANAFIDNPENKPEVNHKNGNRKDNRVENLEWVTHRENAIHGIRVLGRKSNSEKLKGKPCAATRKLTNEQAEAIRNDTRPCKEIAEEYGVSKATIYRIRNGSFYTKKIGDE